MKYITVKLNSGATAMIFLDKIVAVSSASSIMPDVRTIGDIRDRELGLLKAEPRCHIWTGGGEDDCFTVIGDAVELMKTIDDLSA